MEFAKYHGIGNDFVMVADIDDRVTLSSDLVRKLCDRRFGIGADGVIRVAPGTGGADLFLDYWNSDGSLGEMCGNGIRCLAIFARESGLTNEARLQIATRAGMKAITVRDDGLVTVDMGPPAFAPDSIPVVWAGADALHVKIELEDTVVEAACLSMGNPHAVLFVDELDGRAVGSIGPQIETHPMFPNGANVEWTRVTAPDRIEVLVWERGSGATLACGTGACAAMVAARLLRDAEARVTVVLPGGELDVRWEGELASETPVLMTGPATKSFEGVIERL